MRGFQRTSKILPILTPVRACIHFTMLNDIGDFVFRLSRHINVCYAVYVQQIIIFVCVCVGHPDPGVLSDCASERLLIGRDLPGLVSGS